MIRADDAWLRTGRVPGSFVVPSGAIKDVRYDPEGRGLWVELGVV